MTNDSLFPPVPMPSFLWVLAAFLAGALLASFGWDFYFNRDLPLAPFHGKIVDLRSYRERIGKDVTETAPLRRPVKPGDERGVYGPQTAPGQAFEYWVLWSDDHRQGDQ